MLEILFWIFVAPAALAALASAKSGRRFLEHVEVAWKGEPDPDAPVYEPPATVIVPVRGLDHELAANLQSLARQDYPRYELLVVCRSADDPAVTTARMTLGERCRIVIAGDPPLDTGEKVHNLLAAVAAAGAWSDVFVFADSDGQVAEGWLRGLVAPLVDGRRGAATAFRWYFPEEGGGFWSLLRSAWDSTIAGQMSSDDRKNFAWGGATAIRRKVFEQTRVADFWQGVVSDDYRLTHAMQAAGRGVSFVPKAMVATTGHVSRGEFLDWATRQLVITKAYWFKGWLAGFVAHIVYCGAMVTSAALALSGNPLGLGGLAVTVIPGMAKGAMRGYAGRLMFPERENWFDRHGWIYFWLAPVATWVWLWVFLRSALTRTIRWRGYEYELLSKERTRKVGEAEAKP